MRIKKISVKNCGPIKEFDEDLASLNVIYGKNEQGKSFLVEFLIKCLFTNTSNWGYLRNIESSRGKVILEGLGGREVEFSLSSRSKKEQKLEDYFEKDPRGLPPSLCRLLVVKGGEFEIVKNESGVDKNLINDILSGKRILNSIKSNISATIQNAEIEERISINKMGEGKRYYEIKERLEKVNRIIEDVTKQYEAGEIKKIEIEIKELEEKKENLLKAKRYKAYLLSEEINKLKEKIEKLPHDEKISELKNFIEEFNKREERRKSMSNELDKIKKETENLQSLERKLEKILKAKRYLAYSLANEIKQKERELEKIPEDELSGLEGDISRYNEKNNELQRKISGLSELQEKTKHYEWLKEAKEYYLKYLSTPVRFTKFIEALPYLSLLSLMIATVLFLLGQRIPGTIFMLLTSISILWYKIGIKKYLAGIKQKEEVKSISDEFKKYFGFELNNVADIVSILNEQTTDYNKIVYLKDEISRIQENIQNLKVSIQDKFKKLLGTDINEQNWLDMLSELKNKKDDISKNIEDLKKEFNKLDVDETDFVKENPGIKFEKSEFERISKEVERLRELKRQEEEKSNEFQKFNDELKDLEKEIKQAFSEIIGEEVNQHEWKRKIQEIEKKRNDTLKNMKEKEGELRGLGVSEGEYERQNPGVEFSPGKIKEIENRINELKKTRENEGEKLLNLKSEICSFTDSDISSDWNLLIEKLYLKKEEIVRELNEVESNIIAGKLVSETIEELLREENEKIVEVMNSEEVKKLLLTLTKRYNKLSFDDDGNLLVSSDYETFPLKDLSTGAKEQVILALRMGFAKIVMGEDHAFLILDDAFQHSDYERRPILVESLVDLAKAGWQVIYLTMDDNIKELFDEKAKKLKNRYKKIELQTTSYNIA
ncbi:MAG TPA: AAA family ATPase [bacterium]|nr:AAA family ATPase [bacterium]HOM26389.1 AAA family ATPase [bacterium]